MNNIYKSLLIISAITLVGIDVSATGSISGQVRDYLNGQGLAGTTVETLTADEKLLNQTITDATGHYEQKDLPLGKLIVRYTKGGYVKRPTQKDIEIKAGKDAKQDIELFKEDWSEEADIQLLAKRIKENAVSAETVETGYLAQWRRLPDAGVAPEVKAKVADSLKQLDVKSTSVQEIKAFMDLPKRDLRSASEILDLSAHDTTEISSEARARLPNEVKVDIIRYHLQKATLSPNEKEMVLRKADLNFGHDIREMATRPLDSRP